MPEVRPAQHPQGQITEHTLYRTNSSPGSRPRSSCSQYHNGLHPGKITKHDPLVDQLANTGPGKDVSPEKLLVAIHAPPHQRGELDLARQVSRPLRLSRFMTSCASPHRRHPPGPVSAVPLCRRWPRLSNLNSCWHRLPG